MEDRGAAACKPYKKRSTMERIRWIANGSTSLAELVRGLLSSTRIGRREGGPAMKGSTKSIIVCLAVIVGSALFTDTRSHGYRPDPWITLKTKIALLTDIDVTGRRVNVDTVNGHVTLHGEVGSTKERARATEVAKRIEGTIDVRNLLHVASKTGTDPIDLCDDEIQHAVETAFEADPEIQRSGITVESVDAGVVRIAGKAPSVLDHLRAVKTARRVAGVRGVASAVENPLRLTDREVWGEMSAEEDTGITTATKMRFLADNAIPALEVNVDTESGVVTLFGVVPTEDAKLAAEAETSQVNGVKSVLNALQVVPGSAEKGVATNDDDVKKAVKSVLQGSSHLRQVDVEVQNGVARLSGKVPESMDRLQAAFVVRSAPGVRSVKNNLRVATN
jgi:osmotically-inducible protein OsmY